MKINAAIVKYAKSYVTAYLTYNLPDAYSYHNLSHTLNVVKTTLEICTAMNISERERHILMTAAWFHDTGYVNQSEDHEAEGVILAENFLEERKVDKQDINEVKACILSTKYPQKPETLLQKILCDADMAHLAHDNFVATSALLRKEWSNTKSENYSDLEWYELNLDFINRHHYHTLYSSEKFEKQKKKNAKQIERLIRKEKQNSLPEPAEGESKKNDSGKLERGVETLFKTAVENHMQRSSMADSKAH